jgi:hypothetical protein
MDNVQEHNCRINILSSQTFKPYWNERQVYLCIKVGHCIRESMMLNAVILLIVA